MSRVTSAEALCQWNTARSTLRALERRERVHGRPVRRVEDHRQVVAAGQVDQALEALAGLAAHRVRVVGGAEAVPRQPDLAERDQPRVAGVDLRLHRSRSSRVSFHSGWKPIAGHTALALSAGGLQRALVGGVVAADRDRAPHVVLGRADDGAAYVLEGRVVQVAVAVDDHEPATVIRPMSSVGAAVRSRNTRSLPTPSTARNMSSRLPAMVISSTG